MSAFRLLRALGARFDALALRAPQAGADEAGQSQRHAAAWLALRQWCNAPSAPGGRMAVASVCWAHTDTDTDTATDGNQQALTDWVNAFARHMDGGLALMALPSLAARWAMRLRVKGQDLQGAMGQRARQPQDVWDAGWAGSSPPALRQWPLFKPRRATLVMALTGEAELLQLPMALLRQRSDSFDHPMCWLWVGSRPPPLPPGQGPALALG